MVYATDLKSVARKGVRVRVPPWPPRENHTFIVWFFRSGPRYVVRERRTTLAPFYGVVGQGISHKKETPILRRVWVCKWMSESLVSLRNVSFGDWL